MNGFIDKFESFGLVDGPGVRFVVFLSGCNMRCRYCHNPETWDKKHGTEMSVDEVFKTAKRYQNYWEKNGGITVSGGEPLLQMEFVTEFFQKAKKEGISTCLDTSGSSFSHKEPYFSKWKELMAVTDLVLLDIKEMDPIKHRDLTHQDNGDILEMAVCLSDMGIPMWIRHVLVPGLTDSEENLLALKHFIDRLHTVEKVEILPYHAFAIPKWEELGYEYSLRDVEAPTAEQVEKAETILNIQK